MTLCRRRDKLASFHLKQRTSQAPQPHLLPITMKPPKNRFIAISAAFVGFSVPAFADSGTWNTTTSGALWTLNTNWLGSNIADGTGFTADFSQLDIAADTTVALNGTRTIGSLIFGDTTTATAGSWTLNGGANALTLDGATPTITVNALGTGKVVQFNTGFTGSSGFTKNGVGTLILTSSGNTLSGPVTLAAGTLQLNSPSLPSASSVAINGGTLVVATTAANALGGTISFGGGGLQYNSAPGTDYSAQFSTAANQAYKVIAIGGISATFASNLASSGGSLRKDGGGNLTLAAANTFTGTTTIGGGNLILSDALALQNSAIDATNSITGSATVGLTLSGVTTPTFGGLTGTKALSTLFNSSTGGYGSVTNLTLNPGTGANYTYSGAIADGATGMSLTKSGVGSQTLSGNNSYTGGTAINSGTLVLGSANAIGTSGTISFGGGTLKAFNTTDYSSRFSTAASQAYNVDTNALNISWATAMTSSGGTLTKSGTGTLTLTSGLDNTLNGAIAVNGGRLSVTNGTALKNATGPITVASGASFRFSQNFGANNLTNALTLSGTGDGIYGALHLEGNAVATGGITLNADTTISHDWNNATIQTGAITGSGRNLQLTTTQAGQNGIIISSAIQTGAGRISVTGAANSGAYSVQLGGNNTFTGGLVINNGVVQLNSTGALNSTAGSENAVSFGASTTTGKLALNGRSYVISNLISNAAPGSPVVENGNAAAVTLTVGNSQNLSGIYAGVIQNGTGGGALSLTKSGSGTLTLSGTNTYAGTTLISGGTLTLDATGTINNTSEVSLGTVGTFDVTAKGLSGYTVGTLKGSGNVTGALTVSTQLAIGNSLGTSNFSSDLTLGGGSTFVHELTSSAIPGLNSADLGDIAGALTITAGSILDLVQLGSYTAGNKFTLFAYDGLLTGTFKDTSSNVLSDGATFTDAGGIWTIDYNDTTPGANGGASASNTFVTITAVPEPNVAALLGGLGVFALLRRRR